MKIVCPQCNAGYMIPDGKVPEGRTVNATCKRCGKKFAVQSRGNKRPHQPVPPVKENAHGPNFKSANAIRTGTDEAVLAEYPDLGKLPASSFDFSQILNRNKDGSYRSRKNRFKIRVLNSISDILPNILLENEQVVRVAKGTAHYPLEIFLGNGLLTMIYNHYAVLCTSMRILLINIDRRIQKPTHYFFQMSYDELKKVRRGTIFGTMVFVRKKGKKRTITGMKRVLSKEIKIYVNERISAGTSTDQEPIHENLCPACYHGLTKGLLACTTCKMAFKEPQKALMRSLILPGLGDFYLGHRALGTLELIGSVIIWLIIITTLLAGEDGGVAFAITLLVLYNGLDGLLTYHMAKKGYMLA